MANIPTKIEQLSAILKNKHNAKLERDLEELKYIQDLWLQFGDVPMDPETECIDSDFIIQNKDGTQIKFEDGTFREDIWHWFEETFNISVAVDLMY